MPSPVRAVLFDAVGTVLYPTPPPAAAYYAAGRRFGSRIPTTEVAARYHTAFRQQEALGCAAEGGWTNEAREERRWRQIVADVFDDVADADGLFQYLWAHFAAAANWRVFPDVSAAWAELEQRGLLPGLASNFDARLSGVCQGCEPLSRCGRIFVSSSLGVRKPHAAFFAAIEQALGLASSEILLVGDSLENDYRAALAAGWQAVYLCRDGEITREHPANSITDLGELTKLLDRS